jgi:DNA-binding transcriptional regulator YiaG
VAIHYAEEHDHDGRIYQITVPGLEVDHCEKCGAIVLDDLANERVTAEIRRQAGLMNPAEIRTQRLKLSLSQKDMAAALCVAEGTLSRWETGAQIQQRAMDLHLRTFFFVPEAREFMMRTAGLVSAPTPAAQLQ